MPTIKTRDYAARTVRSLNRAGILASRMKNSFIRSRKEQTNESEYASFELETGIAEGLPHVSRVGVIRTKSVKTDILYDPESVITNPEDEAAAENNTSALPHTDNAEQIRVQREAQRKVRSKGSSINTDPTAKHRYDADPAGSRGGHALSHEGAGRVAAQKSEAAKHVAIRKTREAFLTIKEKAVELSKNTIRRIQASLKSLVTAVSAGSAAAIAAIVVICFIGMIVASPYGIFLSKDTEGESITDVVQELSEAYYERIESIKRSVEYDDLEYVSNDGVYSLRWDEILSVYSILVTTDGTNPVEVVTVDADKKDLLKTLLKEMNAVSYSISEETYEEIEITEDEDGNEIEETVEKTKVTLTLRLAHTSASEEASRYGFNTKQLSYLDDMLSGKYSTLWASLIGGYSHVMGIIPAEATWIGTGPFSWPLPINGSITSGFGYRTDPFTGETKFHGGIDIAAAAGTPIVAADGGIVTVANGVDSWGGGYGFYVMIDHGNGYETLYGHCSSICVTYGQVVQKGEVIAYVGSTGNSTGNHLHFEIRIGGQKQDPLIWFVSY